MAERERGGGVNVPRNILPCMREWWERQTWSPDPSFIGQVAQGIRAAGGEVKVYTPVTPLEARAVAAISPAGVRYLPGTAAKRFARQIQGAAQLTDRQRAYLWTLVWKHRRQIGQADVVAEAKRLTQQQAGGGA